MNNYAEIKTFCKVVSACHDRGELTRQQTKTLQGQAKHGDLAGALKGLKRLYEKGEK